MSRDFTDVATDYLDRSGSVITAPPMSISIWFNADDAASSDRLVTFGISGSDSNRFDIRTQNGVIGAESKDAGGSTTLLGVATFSTGVWNHAGMSMDTTFEAVYLNGANKRSATIALRAPVGINYTRVSGSPTGLNNFDGRLAHIAVWNVVLTDEEWASLGANRVSPFKVRPASLLSYNPFIGRDSPEVDIIGGNNLTVNGTTVSASDPPVLWLPGRQKYFIPAVAAGIAPAFSAGPVIVQTTDVQITLGGTPTVACTWYAVAVQVGDTAPSIAQIKAGHNSADVAALGASSQAITGADTLLIAGLTTHPIYDIYSVLNNADGDSSRAAQLGALMLPPSGRQYATLQEPGGGWTTESIPYGASPAIVTGDILDLQAVTDAPGSLPLQVTSDGIASFSGGAGQRQHFTARIYDVSLHAFTAYADFYVNNQAPQAPQPAPTVNLTLNVPMTPVDLRTFFSDAEGDAITCTDYGASAPTGTSVSSSIWSGTPTVSAAALFNIQAVDIVGDITIGSLWVTVGGVTIPDISGVTASQGQVQLEALPVIVSTASEYSDGITLGLVIGTVPVAGTEVAPNSAVLMRVSLGPQPVVTETHFSYGVPRRFGSA